jgi:hypothetical protein
MVAVPRKISVGGHIFILIFSPLFCCGELLKFFQAF